MSKSEVKEIPMIIEFEITGMRDSSTERSVVGVDRIDLSEYVEEQKQKILDKYSENFGFVQIKPMTKVKKKSFFN